MDNLHQVGLILLDFCKAFDTVPHHRLLLKLQSYGITNKTHTWITSWLTQRVQRVVIDGAASGWLPVKSGVPQGTVLGPLMFLIYINDIGKNLSCCLRLFADDCLLYHVITSEEDCAKLQRDLNIIYKWSCTWQMKFNLSKCVTLKCYRSSSPIEIDYFINDHKLENVKHHPYLGITLDQTISFIPHLNNITSKTTRVLNFIK